MAPLLPKRRNTWLPSSEERALLLEEGLEGGEVHDRGVHLDLAEVGVDGVPRASCRCRRRTRGRGRRRPSSASRRSRGCRSRAARRTPRAPWRTAAARGGGPAGCRRCPRGGAMRDTSPLSFFGTSTSHALSFLRWIDAARVHPPGSATPRESAAARRAPGSRASSPGRRASTADSHTASQVTSSKLSS